jgi:5'-3' exonuclease
MILLDNNQIILANMFHSLKTESDINEDLMRHLILNSYRLIRKNFTAEYGEIVICHDSSKSWRKTYFPEYKANRAKTKEKSEYDWDKIYCILNIIRDEICNIFPYKNMKVERCEADDIIAILSKHFHTKEKIVIVSNDKDFQQLQKYPNINQYSNLKREMIICESPETFLLEHILRGDSSDGIPNILSDDDSFVMDDKRQNRLTKKTIDNIVNELSTIETSKYARNWERNQNLIDFNKIPDDVERSILDEWNTPMVVADRSKILPYMITKRLKNLIENIEEF